MGAAHVRRGQPGRDFAVGQLGTVREGEEEAAGCEQTKTEGLRTCGCPVVAGEVYAKGTARKDCTRGQTMSKRSPGGYEGTVTNFTRIFRPAAASLSV